MIDKRQLKKRKIILINKAFQGRFILSVLATIILFGLCSAGIIYGLMDSDLHMQSQTAHVNIANTWERLGFSILLGNIVAAVIAGLMAVIVVLYISHKIAGPLYRFETLCKEVGEGNLDTITYLRANDQLQELAQSFSLMVDKLRKKREHTNETVDTINNKLDSLNTNIQHSTEQLEEIKKLLLQIKEG